MLASSFVLEELEGELVDELREDELADEREEDDEDEEFELDTCDLPRPHIESLGFQNLRDILSNRRSDQNLLVFGDHSG